MDSLVQHNMMIREWLNGGLIPLNASLVLVIGLFLWDSYRTGSGWSHRDGVPTACALFWIFLADGVRAALVWQIIWAQNRMPERPMPIPPGVADGWIISNLGLSLAAMIGALACLRLIYLFAPPRYRHCYWVSAVLIDAAWLAFTHMQ